MTDSPQRERILRVSAETFEQLAFMVAEPGGEQSCIASDVLEARIDFRGPQCGTVLVRVSSELAAQLAATMLASPAGDPDGRQNAGAALTEVLNILAGALIHDWFGAEPYQLGLPRLASVDAYQPSPTATSMLVDGHKVEFELRVSSAQPSTSSG